MGIAAPFGICLRWPVRIAFDFKESRSEDRAMGTSSASATRADGDDKCISTFLKPPTHPIISMRDCMLKLLKKSPVRFAKHLLINQHESIPWLIPDRHSVLFRCLAARSTLTSKESSMMPARSLGLY